VKHGNHRERIFIGSVNDQVIAYRLEAQRLGSEIVPLVALVWERNEFADSVQDVLADTPGSMQILLRNCQISEISCAAPG